MISSVRQLPTSVLLVVVGVVLLSVLVGYFYARPIPTGEDKRFIQTCKELNGKEFSFESISSLNGSCYVHYDEGRTGFTVSVKPCTEKHVQEYVEFDKLCRSYITAEALANSFAPEHPAFKPLGECLRKFHNTSEIWLAYRGSFGITQGFIDDNWVCRIGEIKPFVKAVAEYVYD